MQGYLTELSWQDELFTHARRMADAAEQPIDRAVAPRRGMFKAVDIIEAEEAGESYTGIGVAWVIAENPFIQVELTDLGLIEATGIWTARQLPSAAAAITSPFLKVLQELDVTTHSA